MAELTLNGRNFRISNETVNGAQGFTLREWVGSGISGRNILHDCGIASKGNARELAETLVGNRNCTS